MKKIFKWLDNFWYHNRWIVLISGFFIVVITILTFQYINRDTYDLSLIYAGPISPTALEIKDMETSLKNMVHSDYNGDGQKNIQFINYVILTDEQIEAKQKEAIDQGISYTLNSLQIMEARNQLSTQVFAGETLIYMLDPYWYKSISKQGAFVPLSEILDSVPEYAIDEYAVYLKDTPFARYFTAFKVLPEDTVLCFRTMPSSSALKSLKKEEKRYEFNKQVFINIMEFGNKQ